MRKMKDDLPSTVSEYRGGLPDSYDPKKGLKKMEIAEAAILHFTRAKDAEGLYHAVEVKLGEQRFFVLWWAKQTKRKATPGNLGPSQTRDGPAADDLGLDRMAIKRWSDRLADETKFDRALEAAKVRCRRVCEADKGSTDQKGASGTGENEWYTPDEWLERALRVLGAFDLDPASSDKAQEIVKATTYFTEEQNALEKEWHGRIWLNPPYAQPFMSRFVTKLCEERRAGRVTAAIMVTHNYTDTRWFHEAAGTCDAICFTRGRVEFYDKDGKKAEPTQGQAFFYFGDDVERFAEVFGEHGFIAEIWNA